MRTGIVKQLMDDNRRSLYNVIQQESALSLPPTAFGQRGKAFWGAPILPLPLKICGVNYTPILFSVPHRVHVGFIVTSLDDRSNHCGVSTHEIDLIAA